MSDSPAAANEKSADSPAAAVGAIPTAPPATSNRGRNMVLLAAFLGWMFDGLEQGLFPQIARKSLISLMPGANEGAIVQWHQIIDASFLVGAAFGGVTFGWLGDKIGRVRAMSLSILVYSLFTGMGYFAQAPWHMAALRFISAVGMGGEWSLGVALIMEVWPNHLRPILAGVIGAAANVGFLLISFICYHIRVTPDNWRPVMLIGAAPALLTFLIRIFVPESEKWSESQKHGPTAPLREAFTGRTSRVMWLAIVFASVPLLATWGAVQKVPAWVGNMPVEGQRGLVASDGALLAMETKPENGALVVTELLSNSRAQGLGIEPGTTIRSVEGKPVATPADVITAIKGKKPGETVSLEVLPKAAAGAAATQPATVQVPLDKWVADPDAQAVTGMLMAIGAIIACLLAPLLGAALGRRPAYFLLCLTSLIIVGILFRGFDRYSTGFMLMTFLAGAASAAFYGWLPLYLPELFPTRIRATAQGVAYNTGRIIAAGGALAGGAFVALWGGYGGMGATLSLIYVIGMIVIWFAPETKGKPLPE